MGVCAEDQTRGCVWEWVCVCVQRTRPEDVCVEWVCVQRTKLEDVCGNGCVCRGLNHRMCVGMGVCAED